MKFTVQAQMVSGNDLFSIAMGFNASSKSEAYKAFVGAMRQLGFNGSDYVDVKVRKTPTTTASHLR